MSRLIILAAALALAGCSQAYLGRQSQAMEPPTCVHSMYDDAVLWCAIPAPPAGFASVPQFVRR